MFGTEIVKKKDYIQAEAMLEIVQPSCRACTKEMFKARLHSERKPLKEHVLKFFKKSLFGT